MSGQTQVRRAVTRGNGEKVESNESSKGANKLLVSVSWSSVKRGRKRYYNARLLIPAEIREKLGLRPGESAEFEVELRMENDKPVIVYRLVRKSSQTVHA